MVLDSYDVFGYRTYRVVKVKDRRLGILYRAFQSVIVAYIIFSIIMNELYLKTEPPVPGAVRITLQAPPTFKVPSYCNGGTYPCVFWSEDAIRYPDDGAGVAFFTTRVSSTNYVPPPGCDFSKASLPTDQCFFDPNSPTIRRNTLVPTSFIGDIEDYTMMIEHSVRGKITSVAIRNGLLDGALMSHDGKLIRNFNNATRMGNNSRADGDIFTVKEMLDAAGANLDGPSTAPGANKTIGEINRTSGIVVVIVIEYKNRHQDITYKYIPQVIEGNEYKAVERITNVTDGSVTLVNRHGIRFVFQQHGTIGQFDFLTLLTNIVGGLALFKLAEALVEFLMLMVLPEKEFYGIAKFQETNSFDEWREYKKQLKNEKRSTTNPNVTNVNRPDNTYGANTGVYNNNNVNTGSYYNNNANTSNYYHNNANAGGHFINMNNTGGHYNHHIG